MKKDVVLGTVFGNVDGYCYIRAFIVMPNKGRRWICCDSTSDEHWMGQLCFGRVVEKVDMEQGSNGAGMGGDLRQLVRNNNRWFRSWETEPKNFISSAIKDHINKRRLKSLETFMKGILNSNKKLAEIYESVGTPCRLALECRINTIRQTILVKSERVHFLNHDFTMFD